MARIEHPIGLPVITEPLNCEQLLGHEMAEIVGVYAVDGVEYFGGALYVTFSTARLDAESNGPQRAAFRFKSLPVFPGAPTDDASAPGYEDDDSHTGVVLEHGVLAEDGVILPDDSSYEWSAYALAVLSTEDPYSVHVLDAQTGSRLLPIDLERVAKTVSMLHQAFRFEGYTEIVTGIAASRIEECPPKLPPKPGEDQKHYIEYGSRMHGSEYVSEVEDVRQITAPEDTPVFN